VLLLDEPTTGLDAASGQRVLAPLRRLMTGRTTIIISHDLHTVTDADEIVVLDGGAVSAVGRHEELLATSPIYAQLYALHQPSGRIATPVPPVAARPPVAPPPVRNRPRSRGVLAAVVDVATTPIWMVPRTGQVRGSTPRASAPPPAPPPGAAAPTGAPPVAATTPLRATRRGRHARQSPPDAPATQRPPRHALGEAGPAGPAPRANGTAAVTAPGLARPLPGPRAAHDVPS
jgi:ATP-binding cassette subfamily B protein/subfamily B ATP-binding cassette protein MsbA